MKYLIILLDDTSVPFCHYNNNCKEPKLISIEDLKNAIKFGMKENLMIQFVYPNYTLPNEYLEVIGQIDHFDIKSGNIADNDAVAVVNLEDFASKSIAKNIIVRSDVNSLNDKFDEIEKLIYSTERINLILTDLENIGQDDVDKYIVFLDKLVVDIICETRCGKPLPQLNILTDRLLLTQMNNCNAGTETVTIAPDGKFYVCPAFYYDSLENGYLNDGKSFVFPNSELYKLDHAPICRGCDAYHCHRCVWLNKKRTFEVNTPGHFQCVISHVERKASRKLLLKLREIGECMPEINIPEIDYLDPFDKLINKR